MAVVVMPEAAVYKNNRPVLRENKVRLSRKITNMQPVPQSCGMHGFSDLQLRLCVTAFDGSHISASRLGIVNVRQSGRFLLPRFFHQSPDVRQHNPRDLAKDGHSNRVAKLFVGLGI